MSTERSVPLYNVHLPRDAYQGLEALLAQGQLASGPLVNAFESGLSSYLGNPLTLATGDVSSSISLSLMLAGLEPGDEVVLSPMVCLATSCPVATQFAKVRWCDIDPATGNLDPARLAEAITLRTRAILVYHWAGNPSDMAPIQALAQAHGIPVIEDAGEALGAVYGGFKIGNTGSDYTVFSFYPNRHITTIEGGAISFKNEPDFERARWLRRYGIHVPSFRLEDGEINPDSDIPRAGLNTTLNQIGASIGLRQLEHLENIVARHQDNGLFYDSSFAQRPEIQPLRIPVGATSARWVYTILADRRDELRSYLRAKGVQSSRVHLRNDRYSCFGAQSASLPGVEAFSMKALSLPCGWWVQPADREYVVHCIESFYRKPA